MTTKRVIEILGIQMKALEEAGKTNDAFEVLKVRQIIDDEMRGKQSRYLRSTLGIKDKPLPQNSTQVPL